MIVAFIQETKLCIRMLFQDGSEVYENENIILENASHRTQDHEIS